LALYAGHGEFERIIYAPANVSDAFEIGQLAFQMAQKHRVPVFMLCDQAILETIVATDAPKIKENEEFQGPIPSATDTLVCADSDEHDAQGFITEDLELRVQNVNKRLEKRDAIEQDALPPWLEGDAGCENLIVSWGSNFEVLKAAIQGRDELALLHLRQLWPLCEDVFHHLKGKNLIVVEQNATGQLEKLIRQEFGLCAEAKLLKYNGMPFCIEEIQKFLEGIKVK
jgi:2-oxoglutarate ferredoxin oxidoreductase subunit alpha